MDLSNNNSQSVPEETSKLMIEKTAVISALKKLIDDYPSEIVPHSVVKQALAKVMGSSIGDMSDHPALLKLDQILIKARSVTST